MHEQDSKHATGTLYVVATPIGNLADLSPRAVQVLNAVGLIASEDTRHSSRLRKAHDIQTPMMALHQHNEAQVLTGLIDRLKAGQSVALISDAGTPLISDPGSLLIQQAHLHQVPVSPIPGPCAAIAALSAAGIDCDRFVFEGFLPPKAQARQAKLEALQNETRTMVFYEAPHRLLASLTCMRDTFGPDHVVTLAAELSKIHEKVIKTTLGLAVDMWQDKAIKGEWVLVLAGCEPKQVPLTEIERLLCLLLEQCSLRQSVKIAHEFSKLPKNQLYKQAVALQKMVNISSKNAKDADK